MAQHLKLDLRPYLAAAVARNDRAYQRGRVIYYEHLAECEAAAHKSGCISHRAITACRAEYEIKARQMLGVIAYCETEDVTAIVRRGWPAIYSHFAGKRPMPDVQYTQDNDLMDTLIVYCFLCLIFDREPSDQIKRELQSMQRTFEMHHAELTPSAEEQERARRLYPCKAPGTAALDDTPHLEDIAAPFENLAYEMGLDLSDYLHGIEFSKQHRALCALLLGKREELAAPLGYFAMLISAIKADRKYLIETHAEKLIADAQKAQTEAVRAKQEAERADERAATAERMIAELREQLATLEAQRNRLQAELDERAGDVQELAALRSALYAAEQEDEQVSNDTVPELPADLRIVCMGGHQRWITQMRDALPDVVYIPAGSSADDQIIRNADAVWFRADYMSHSAYIPAIAACRAAKIPVYYFSARGADRCAAELCRTMAARKE